MTTTNGAVDLPPGITRVEKACSACKQTKPYTEFYRDSVQPDGLTSQCKVCRITRAKEKAQQRKKEKAQRVVQAPAPVWRTEAPATTLAPSLIKATVQTGSYFFNPSAVALYDCTKADEVIVVLQTFETRLEPVPNTPNKTLTTHPITFRVQGAEAKALRAVLEGAALPLSEDHAKDEQLYQEWEAADKRASAAETEATALRAELAALKERLGALLK